MNQYDQVIEAGVTTQNSKWWEGEGKGGMARDWQPIWEKVYLAFEMRLVRRDGCLQVLLNKLRLFQK